MKTTAAPELNLMQPFTIIVCLSANTPNTFMPYCP